MKLHLSKRDDVAVHPDAAALVVVSLGGYDFRRKEAPAYDWILRKDPEHASEGVVGGPRHCRRVVRLMKEMDRRHPRNAILLGNTLYAMTLRILQPSFAQRDVEAISHQLSSRLLANLDYTWMESDPSRPIHLPHSPLQPEDIQETSHRIDKIRFYNENLRTCMEGGTPRSSDMAALKAIARARGEETLLALCEQSFTAADWLQLGLLDAARELVARLEKISSPLTAMVASPPGKPDALNIYGTVCRIGPRMRRIIATSDLMRDPDYRLCLQAVEDILTADNSLYAVAKREATEFILRQQEKSLLPADTNTDRAIAVALEYVISEVAIYLLLARRGLTTDAYIGAELNTLLWFIQQNPDQLDPFLHPLVFRANYAGEKPAFTASPVAG